MIQTDITNFKYIDEEDNEYIVTALSDYNKSRYALLVNLKDETDNFIAKLIFEKNDLSLEIVDDKDLISNIIDDLAPLGA